MRGLIGANLLFGTGELLRAIDGGGLAHGT
jgi:hypothetical protein